MRVAITVGLSGAMAAPALAADISLNVEIPRLTVAEYHRPYVAIWLERPDNTVAANLAVWYDVNLRNNEGTKWLKDLRQWWRRTGRELSMPADGLTSATRAPGQHSVEFAGSTKPLSDLPPGEYQLVVEAAREVGGRELLRVPVQWPPREAVSLTAKGEHELGTISVSLKP
jgi:hypothetical protein